MRIYYACKTSLTFTAAYQPEYQLQETVLNPRALKVQIHRLLGFERFLTTFPCVRDRILSDLPWQYLARLRAFDYGSPLH